MPDGPRTRSQTGEADGERRHDDANGSSDSDSLNNTLVENNPSLNGGAIGIPSTTASTYLPANLSTTVAASMTAPFQPPQSIATPEVLSTLMATITSLKSAVDELRQESRRNNIEISSIRSQIVENPHKSSTLQRGVEDSIQPTHETMSPSISQKFPLASQAQHIPPVSQYQQSPSALYCQNFQLSSQAQYMPPVPHDQQLPSASCYQNLQLSSQSQHLLHMRHSQYQELSSTPQQYQQIGQQYSPTYVQQMPPATASYLPPLTNCMSSAAPYCVSSSIQVPPPTTTSIQQQSQQQNSTHLSMSNTPMSYHGNLQNSELLRKLYHLPDFDGKPEDWPLFLATYEDTSVEFGYTNRQNLMRLQKALHGAAKDCVMSMLIYPENVSQIIDELQFNFGRPELLIKSQLEKIKAYPAITEGRLDGILGLATCAKNIVAFFKSAKCENHLTNPTLLEQIVMKLPMSKQYEWAKFSVTVLPFPTLEHFAKWVGELARFCSLMPHCHTAPTNDRQHPSSTTTTRRVLHSNEEQPGRKECQQCKGSHELNECIQFKDLTINAKWEQVKCFRVCFSCLRKGHNLTQCRRKKLCATNGCRRYHNPILHQDIAAMSTVNNTEQPGHVLQCHQNEGTSQLFKIMPVTLHGPNGSVTVYALLDEGSSVSLLEEDVAKSMGLKGQKSSITLQWYDNMRKTESSMKVNVEISPAKDYDKKYTIRNLHTVKELSLPVQSFDKSIIEHLKYLPIEDYLDKKPSILIGLDNCFLGLAEQVVEMGADLPVASATKLGWVAYGPILKKADSIARVCHINEFSAWKEVHKMVIDYFSVENFGVRATDMILESEENKRARNILEDSIGNVDGRYEIGLLWRMDDIFLPESFEMARQRLLKVENKMARDPGYAASYKGEIDKYISKGYAKLLSPTEAETDVRNYKKVWYLPHFGVINPHKPVKLRIVFDAAATSLGVSLNSALLKGPEHAKPLQTILYQFRQGKIAVAGDIQEMFSQVSIIAADQNSQRFLWRNGERDNDMRVYVMQSMIFGAICSPCCAEYVKNFNAGKFESSMPRGAKAVKNNTYVDDLVISFNSIEEALEVTTEAIHINAAAGFNLRNFSSNDCKIESRLNHGDMANSTTLKMERQDQTDKILGLYWNKSTDCFEFHVKFHKICTDVLEGKRPPTKREVLGITMPIFDPFGFLANFTIMSKLLVQKTWKLCLQWDDPLPEPILSQWKAWWRDFDRVKHFSIPRCYSTLLAGAEEIQLHIFVDASSGAYAAVAYLRIKYKTDVHVSFVVAKSRCAPPRGMTIPRLELQAAVLGCRLKTSIEESHEFTINRTIFWSDSKTVILWIRSTEREYKQFVACRIAEILSATDLEQWRWLPTNLNVADEATRAKLSANFDPNSRWLVGPEFLRSNERLWPIDPQISEINQCRDEERVDRIFLVKNIIQPLMDFTRFSKFLRLKRCAAWILRFINIKTNKPRLISRELTAAEIESGEKLICRQVQMEVYGSERSCLIDGNVLPKSCSIYQLTPYVDDEMLLRVNGRIDNAYCLPHTARNPVIMPTKHPVTLMIVAYYHQRAHHQNDHIAINEIRQKFWVPYIRSVLKSIKKLCPTCIRDSAKPIPPLMGQLPVDRLTPYIRPFSYVGLDYCGPFYVTIGRRREKRWIALFTCLTTRALHLEISVDLSTDAFLLCMRNFVNRRGLPVRIRSDNGTNFIGAQKEMTHETRFFDFDEIQRNLSKDNIEWVFNCPANPHAGGCWERLVRCVKQLLYKIFKEEAPRLETFRSAMIEAECLINNRPLTELPIDPDSEEPLTPNHFLIGGVNSTQTPGPFDEKVCLRKQWRIAQNIKDRLWKRWVVEYLPQLLKRPKWREEADPLQLGDMVLVLDPNQPRGQWKMGRINQVFSGRDGQIRSAEVKTANGLIRRPAVKLAVLKFNESSS